MARRKEKAHTPAADGDLYPQGVPVRVPPVPRVKKLGTVREHIAAMESAALAYATEHATSHRIRPAYLARVAFDALAADAGYLPSPVDLRDPGARWSTRPPHPLVLAARERIDPAPPRVVPVVPSLPAPF